MAQNFYTKWQDAILADAGDYVSKEYRSFQTALVREISKYAAAVGAKVASNSKGHYDTSCFIERNGKFVYIWKSHATLTLLATQDLPTFGYNMIDPLKSWCWGSILFYPFKISRFS